jgi:uncharacterized OB-fold protein
MLRPCDQCGTEYLAKRASSKYCSERCKKRAQRSPGIASVVPITSASSEPTGEPDRGLIEAATFAELEAVGQEKTALGALAVMLARRLDGISADTGSSVAAVVREHKKTLSDAIAAGTAAADPLDELTKRRQERRALA